MLLVVEITGFLCMLTIMFVGIWGFILLNQIFGQIRYKNYLMEKLTQHVYMLSNQDDKDKKEEEKLL